MQSKTFQVRDEGTNIPVLVIQLEPDNEQSQHIFYRAGLGKTADVQRRTYYLINLARHQGFSFPYSSKGRTLQVAHKYIEANFDRLESGQVIDVEFLLGITTTPKTFE